MVRHKDRIQMKEEEKRTSDDNDTGVCCRHKESLTIVVEVSVPLSRARGAGCGHGESLLKCSMTEHSHNL